MGDYFLVGDLDRELLDKLTGVRYEKSAVETALEGVDTESIILNMTKTNLINLLFKP